MRYPDYKSPALIALYYVCVLFVMALVVAAYTATSDVTASWWYRHKAVIEPDKYSECPYCSLWNTNKRMMWSDKGYVCDECWLRGRE